MGLAPELITHRISDEELTMLVDQTRYPLAEMFSAATGVALTAAYPALLAIENWGRPGATLTDLIMLAAFAGSTPLALAMGWLWWNRRKDVQSLQAKIRARHRLPVESRTELDYHGGPSGA